ncbi:phosphatidylinositol-specific phospholipase C [Massilia sp. W12]|uniref:phosphatidylinositol-specific phospholipase C n=1 Tax=Massilia sp. W12 TaxID=3126507 RepID=UPI0030D28DD8
MSGIFARLLTACAFTLGISLAAGDAYSHNHPAYSHDAQVKTNQADWMRALPDHLPLSRLSIPGTHDTMSFYGGDAVQTQSMSLPQQLQSGVRMLDIRCRRIDNKFAIHHGFVYQHANYDDVLQAVTRFLAEHPGETVLMRVKEEYEAANTTMSFAQIFNTYANDARYSQYFWRGANIPTLREVRGKIVLLRDFSGIDWGLHYGSLNAQDAYHLRTNWDLYSKWEKIKAQLESANAERNSTTVPPFFLNYLSGSGGSFPYFVVSGHSSPGTSAPRLATGLTTPGWKNSYPDFPRVSCFIGICTIAFEGSNVLTQEYIERKGLQHSGIVITDFPGPGLLDTIIRLNQRLR